MSAKASDHVYQRRHNLTIKDTPTETMGFMLDLHPTQTRQKVEPVKAYFSAIKQSTQKNSTKPRKTQRVADMDAECLVWVKPKTQLVLQAYQLRELKQTKGWERYPKQQTARSHSVHGWLSHQRPARVEIHCQAKCDHHP